MDLGKYYVIQEKSNADKNTIQKKFNLGWLCSVRFFLLFSEYFTWNSKEEVCSASNCSPEIKGSIYEREYLIKKNMIYENTITF